MLRAIAREQGRGIFCPLFEVGRFRREIERVLCLFQKKIPRSYRHLIEAPKPGSRSAEFVTAALSALRDSHKMYYGTFCYSVSEGLS